MGGGGGGVPSVAGSQCLECDSGGDNGVNMAGP